MFTFFNLRFHRKNNSVHPNIHNQNKSWWLCFPKEKKTKKTQRFKTFSSFNHIWTSNFFKWESFVILFASSRHAQWPIENLFIGFYLLAEARKIWSFNNSSINPLAIFLFFLVFTGKKEDKVIYDIKVRVVLRMWVILFNALVGVFKKGFNKK